MNDLSSMIVPGVLWGLVLFSVVSWAILLVCLLYTSDAADE